MEKNLSTIKINNPFVLAPMAGVTDRPFRTICKSYGASLVYSEMISAKGMFYEDKNTDKLLLTSNFEQPLIYQIFGSEPDIIKFAVDALNDRDNVAIDINMGCPVPKIVKNGEGSALMKNPDLIYDLIKAAKSVTDKPISAKIRLGWDKSSINGLEVASAIESAGGDFIAIHGRTREQFYSGAANWEEISRIKRAITLPLIGNGDIYSGIDGVNFLIKYGVDAVMIGQGAMGNPFIFKDLNNALSYYEKNGSLENYEPLQVSNSEKLTTLLKQFNLLVEEKGEYVAVRQIRSHGAWYLKGIHGASKTKQELNKLQTADAIRAFIQIIITNSAAPISSHD